jgi:hypothetical protein
MLSKPGDSHMCEYNSLTSSMRATLLSMPTSRLSFGNLVAVASASSDMSFLFVNVNESEWALN